MTPEQIRVMVIVVAAFALLISERLRNDLIAVLIVVALYVSQVATASEALAGFSSEPAIVVAGIFVLSASLHQTGLSDMAGAWIGRLANGSMTRAIAVIMPSVALLSAFTHHVTTTAIMLPIALNLSRTQNIPASKLLMPLSFAASLGTTITIIGAPAFLIASQILQQSGRPGLGVFSIAPIGLALSVAGTVFVLAARFLLPVRQGSSDAPDQYRLESYLTELAILPESPYIGKRLNEIGGVEGNGYSFQVLGRVGAQRSRGRAQGRPLAEGDVLLIRTSPDEMAEIREDPGVELRPIDQYRPESSASGADDEESDRLVQVVVAPGSGVVGRTVAQVDFRRRYGVIVVALWRQGDGLAEEIDHVRLHAGDVLVVQGDDEAVDRLANDRAFLMVLPFHAEPRMRRRAPIAGAIMLATVLLAAFNLMTIEMAAVTGAVAVVLARCLTARQAYAAIDSRIYVFIAGAIPLGTAMQKTGASQVIGSALQQAVGGWNPILTLLAIFAVVSVLTQFMSDSATTALFGPIAVALAQGLGHNPEAYVVAVAMASVVAFLTPIGHHGNLLIYGPGGYRFSDFVRVGTPLTIISGLIVAFLSPLVWPL